MIDTDKYEGYISGPWKLRGYFSSWKIYWFDKEMSDNWDNIRDFGEEYRHEDFCHDVGVIASTEANARLMADAPLLLAEVKRLQKENKILAKYMDIVNKYDDALLADGDTDPRWSELYD